MYLWLFDLMKTFVNQGAGTTTQYTYNPTGFRDRKIDSNKTTYYVRDASGNTVAIYEKEASSSDINLTEMNIYGAGRLGMAYYEGDNEYKYYYEIKDHLGSVRKVVSEQGMVQTTDYYPFGLEMRNINGSGVSFRYGYQGDFSEKDEETGFNHFEARDYDPTIGRWMVPDPAGQHASPYLAYSNNPVIRVDPNGTIDGKSGTGLGMINIWEGRVIAPTGNYISITGSATLSLVHNGSNWAISATVTVGGGLGYGYTQGFLSSVTIATKGNLVSDVYGAGGSAGGFLDLGKIFPNSVIPPLSGEFNFGLNFDNAGAIFSDVISQGSLSPLSDLVPFKGFTVPTFSPLSSGHGGGVYGDLGWTFPLLDLSDPAVLPAQLKDVISQDQWTQYFNDAKILYDQEISTRKSE